jgi:hypothetical protein
MGWRESLWVAVASGVLVPAILGGVRFAWNRRRVPTLLARAVRRKNYLGVVLSESRGRDLTTLDVLAPRLTSAGANETLLQIQASWEKISERGRVRVLTLDSEECLRGGAELADGIEVRIGRRDLGSEGLSYHLFGVPARAEYTAIVNHHRQDSTVDRPVRVGGSALAQVLRDHFELVWSAGKPLESVLAERAIDTVGPTAEPSDVLRRMTDVRARLSLNSRTYGRMFAHVAFRHGSSVVFVVGLPGAGKSLVRRRLATRLRAMGIEPGELSDYPYAYRDFLHGRLLLQPPRGTGFEPYEGGAFTVDEETALMPALQSLSRAVRESTKEHQVTVVEFARTDLVTAFQEFDELRHQSRVIHVEASASLRADRLNRRAEPPDITVDNQSLLLKVSDNHALPSAVNDGLYRADDIDRLAASPRWRNRVFRIDNSVDDGGARVDARLQSFIEAILDSYRTTTGSSSATRA